MGTNAAHMKLYNPTTSIGTSFQPSGTLGAVATSGTAVCYVSSVNPIGGAVGDLAVQNLSWPTSGTVTGWGL